MKRYTDEELSRILTAHEARLLIRDGYYWRPSEMGCANQFAYNEANSYRAYLANPTAAASFDEGYRRRMSPEELLAFLEDE